MFEYPYDKYQYYIGKNKVVAVSTYAGRRIRGVAKCDPKDTFDLEKGKKLAAARCNLRVAEKRRKNAARRLNEAREIFDQAEKYAFDMEDYFRDAKFAHIEAQKEVEDILKEM